MTGLPLTTRPGCRPVTLWRVVGAAAAACLCAAPAGADWGSKSEKELTREADAYVKVKPEPLQHFFHTLYMEGEWNSVLNLNLLALAALEIGQHELAERALDQSTARILRIYSDDPNAAAAKSLWSAESVKDFKGEPYERAMAFFYRGLLYLREGDFQNARASFIQSDLQNAMGQTERYDRSFALPVFLAAWASSCDGDESRAAELLAQARKSAVDPYFKQVGDRLPRHITLMERGLGPEKVTLGDAKSILSFLPQPDVIGAMRPVYEKEPAPVTTTATAANMDWLALTRGGRPIQGILDGKAAFKATTGSIAEVGGQVASALYQSLGQLGPDKLSVAKNMASLGLGAQLIGSLAGMASSRTNTEADTRYWASLPKYFVIESVDTGKARVTQFATSTSAQPRPVLLSNTESERCSFAFGREFSALDAVHGGVGNPSPWPAEPLEDNRKNVNEAFRAYLRSSL